MMGAVMDTAPKVLVLSLLLRGIVFAGGAVEGTVVLDQLKPAPARPGYKPQTQKPVEKPEAAPAVVYLETAVASSAAAAPAKPLRIRQQGYQFRPSVAVVRAGTQVEFPNEDDEFHNVFSFSKAKRFDLGRYRRDELSPAVVFDKPGLVRIFCEIHQHMRCTILVVDTPHFTLTDTGGRFRLENVPAGEHRLKVLLPSEKTLEMKVVIAEGGTARVNPGS